MLEKRVWWRINRAQQAEVQQTKQAPSGGEVAYDCASCGCVSKLVRQGTLSLEVTVVRAGQLGLGAVGAWNWEGEPGGEGSSERGTQHCARCVAAVGNAARPSQSQNARQPDVTTGHGRSICFCVCDALQPCWLEALELELVLQAEWHDR